MKLLFFTTLLLMSLLATAGTNTPLAVKNFKITSANYDPAHIVRAGEGTLTVDYTAAVVRLEIVRSMFCPANKMCAQVMPMPLSVELPIKSMQTDSCGIHHVVAAVDQRPVDGDLQQLSVDDPTDITCQTFVAVIPQAQFLTSFYDRINGGVVKNVSTMQLELIRSTK